MSTNSKRIFNILGIVLIPLVLITVLVSNQTNLFKGSIFDGLVETEEDIKMTLRHFASEGRVTATFLGDDMTDNGDDIIDYVTFYYKAVGFNRHIQIGEPDSSYTDDSTAQYQSTWNTSEIPNGQYELTAVATLLDGTVVYPNWDLTREVTNGIDISLSLINTRSTANTITPLAANASGSDVNTSNPDEIIDYVMFYYQPEGSEQFVPIGVKYNHSYGANWDQRKVINGTYNVVAVATLLDGQIKVSNTISVTVDDGLAAPAITSFDPVEVPFDEETFTTLPEYSVTITGANFNSLKGNYQAGEVLYPGSSPFTEESAEFFNSIVGVEIGGFLLGGVIVSDTEIFVQLQPGVSTGRISLHKYHVTFYSDIYQAISPSDFDVPSQYEDSVAPTFLDGSLRPVLGATTSSSTQAISIRTNEEARCKISDSSASFSYNQSESAVLMSENPGVQNGHRIEFTDLEEENHTYYIKCIDRAGNVTSRENAALVDFSINIIQPEPDPEGPTIVVNSPTPGQEVESSFEVSATVTHPTDDEITNVEVRISGNANRFAMNRVGTTNEYTYTFNSSSLTTDSTYGLRVYATSANGITNEKFLTVRKVGEELDPETETTITSISPISGPVGTTVFINGTNFNELKGEAESSAPDQVIVSFGSNIEDATQAVVSTSVSDTQIIATVPSSALTGRIYIKKPWAPVNTYIASTTNFTVERETDPSAVAPVVTIDHPEAGVPVNGNRATTYIDATTDIASVCYYDQTDFVFSDTGETGQELIRTGGTNLIHGRTINIEDNRSYTLYVKCAPKSNYDAGTVTADLIGSANITFSVTEATTCGYLELNRTKRVRVLNSIYGGMPITPGVTSLYTDFANRINELNPDIDAADIPEPFSSSNAETVINDWVDFINNADTSECNYEDVKTFNTNPVPEVDIEEPDEDETTGTNITLEVETDIASECKASFQDLEYSDDDDDNLEMEATNDDDDEFELEIEDIEEGETTIYVKCASKEDPTQIGEEEVTFTVEEVAPDGDLECTIDGDEDEFDPSLENIRFTYSVTGNSDVDEVDYTLSIENESGVEVLLLKTDRNEELDLEDLTKDWDGLVDGDRLVDGNYKAILRAEDKDDDRVTCTDEYEFELDDSLVDGIVLELEALDTIFEPTTSHVDIRLVNRVDGDRVVVNAYQLENAAPIRTIFYQCDNGEKCPQNKGELSKGYHDLKWDGSDSSGRFVAPGEYFFKVSLKDDDDNVFVAFSEAVEAQGYVGGGTPYPGAPTPPLFGTACSFTDVSPTDPDYQAVQWVCANGIFTGSNGTMNINQPLLRVDFIAVANRLAACSQTTYDPQFDGNLGFSDLTPVINDPSANWYLREIKNASRDCVSRGQTINGYPDGTIRIANQLVASEMWKVIIEAAKNGNKANYTFVADTSKNPWFTDYQTLLQTNGVPLTPADQGMTRRDAIRLLHNMYLRGLIR